MLSWPLNDVIKMTDSFERRWKAAPVKTNLIRFGNRGPGASLGEGWSAGVKRAAVGGACGGGGRGKAVEGVEWGAVNEGDLRGSRGGYQGRLP